MTTLLGQVNWVTESKRIVCFLLAILIPIVNKALNLQWDVTTVWLAMAPWIAAVVGATVESLAETDLDAIEAAKESVIKDLLTNNKFKAALVSSVIVIVNKLFKINLDQGTVEQITAGLCGIILIASAKDYQVKKLQNQVKEQYKVINNSPTVTSSTSTVIKTDNTTP